MLGHAPFRSALRLSIAATGAVGLIVGAASAGRAAPTPTVAKLAGGVATSTLTGSLPGEAAPLAELPRHGRLGFLLELSVKPTATVYAATKRSAGVVSARGAARTQLATVGATQRRVIADLPGRSTVLYRTHAALAGVAVVTDVRNYRALRSITGVAAVYPIAAKKPVLSYAVPYQRGDAAWQAYGDLGQHSTIAIIDTGSDYTHADLGGPGTVEAYENALANDTEVPAAGSYDPNKFNATTLDVSGEPAYMYDFAGDAYDARSGDPDVATPHPDPNPLDCAGHGSHVAGIAAGYGEWGNGQTYDGPYGKQTPFDALRIGPGVAPRARILSYKVFGCAGSTNITGAAIDKAMDPNGDGDTSDHADVVNMSLGSDFTYPDDGDAVLVNEAAEIAGVTMVVASGNAGDLYDAGGSPGDAVRALTVASSQDASSIVDALHVVVDGTQHDYPGVRSVAYDWTNHQDLAGQVARLTQPGDVDGCLPITSPYREALAGKVAFVDWDANDITRPCGSVARATNLVAAGAIGFIYGSSAENFSAGITGSALIPGVLVAKSGGDAIRTALMAGQPVQVTGTAYGGYDQIDASLNDTLSAFSSRGIHDAGNVKPDVTAIGASVWSAGMGTGTDGLVDSGTSMAAPMVAGTAALVKSKHPDWSPEQVKADIMNTAHADLYEDPDFSGPKYAPNRVGTGRLDIRAAVGNSVLAYTIDGPNGSSTGAVSASWGALELPVTGGEWTDTKTIRLQNTGLDAATYDVSFRDRTRIPGVTYSVEPATVTVEPRQHATVTLTLTIHPARLTKPIDATAERGAVLPRQYLADASGLVVFENQAVKGTDLRVPAYAAPRPASTMTQPSLLRMPAESVQRALLPLSGAQVQHVGGQDSIQSLVSGFELQATSGVLPQCTLPAQSGCWTVAEQRAADLKYVAATTDAPQLTAAGEDPASEGQVYFAIATQAPFRHPVSQAEFDIFIDTTGDDVPDAVVFNARVPASARPTDVMVTEVVDLATGSQTIVGGLNASLGDTDTAIFDSDVLVLPVPLAALPGFSTEQPRINYAVSSFDYETGPSIDNVGTIVDNGRIVGGLSLDLLHPGVSVHGSYDGTSSPILFVDSPSTVLAVQRDVAAYRADHGRGVLMVHFHNLTGHKAQVVSFAKAKPRLTLAFSPNTLTKGDATRVTITVSGAADTPIGSVVLHRLTTGQPVTVRRAQLVDGAASFDFTPARLGTLGFVASYTGDRIYTGATSRRMNLVVHR